VGSKPKIPEREQPARLAWALFDGIIAQLEASGTNNPWRIAGSDKVRYEPDTRSLGKLLGVPVLLGSVSQTGLLAVAVDVWLSYEFRRAGFAADAVWPRATPPRVLPQSLSAFVAGVPQSIRPQITNRFDHSTGTSTSKSGAAPASANILGKNYVKQVDVGISDWATGPELLISTKRMDSSYSNNALNRIEESYGDAKNLRLRHPLAALGFVFVLSSGILAEDKRGKLLPKIKDLLAKLGQEEDAYHSVMLVMPDYLERAGTAPLAAELADRIEADRNDVISQISHVSILHEQAPPAIAAATFFEKMIGRVLDNTPVDFHEEARRLRDNAVPTGSKED